MSNILFFFSTTNIGGAETNILKLSKSLEGKGYKIFWAFFDNSGPMIELADFEFKYFHSVVIYSIFHKLHLAFD